MQGLLCPNYSDELQSTVLSCKSPCADCSAYIASAVVLMHLDHKFLQCIVQLFSAAPTGMSPKFDNA